MFDMSGNGDPYDVNYNLYSASSGKGKLRIRLELLSVATISEVELYPLNRDRNRAHLYDRENQAWLLESDVSMDNLTLRLYYVDVTNVPRKFTRFVCWRSARCTCPYRGLLSILIRCPILRSLKMFAENIYPAISVI